MSCVLSIIGENLDIDVFVNKSDITWDQKWYKGEPINKVSTKKTRHSGASIITSDADFDDVKTQIDETIEFLTTHHDKLAHILTTPEIQFATIDFGVDSTLDEDHLVQGFYFTKPLIKICAELNIEIELSLYKPDMQVILERKRTEKLKK